MYDDDGDDMDYEDGDLSNIYMNMADLINQ